ncbi:MAG: TolC family outer membrane protein [Rubrivivax sp.]|nr:TolC family outer membrane protein [Rubrivivax sp.]
MRSNFTPRPSALVAALLLALPALAGAQSLQELYDAARVFDATYLAAKANAASVEYRAAQSEALLRPSLAATAGASLSQTDPPGSSAKSTQTLSGALNGRYPLINRASGVTIEQARKSLVTAQADLDSAEQDLILRVAQAYFDVLAAQDTLATTRANKAATAEQLASAKRNFEVGTATITDTREAQARFDLGTFQELAAENDLRTKRLALDTLVGRPAVEPKPLRVPVVLPAPVPANPEEWVTLADQGHPSVRRARIGLEVAQLETSKARAGESPTLDAVASLSAANSRGSLPDLSRSAGTSTVGSVGVQMNWPLYTGGATQNRIKETLLLEEKSRNDLEAARRGVVQGTRTAYFGVQSGLSQVKALEAAESSSALALEATQLGYKVGVRVNLDVLNSQLQLFTTRRDLARARYDVLVGSLRLRQAAGQLKAADIDAINRLLAP